MSDLYGDFAAVAVALYVAHHVGDYWIQTDHQARHKGERGRAGRVACLAHVGTYVLTQALMLLPLGLLGVRLSPVGLFAALAVSGLTHYAADRREYGLMFKLARAIPGKANFMRLGVPRPLVVECKATDEPGTFMVHLDNPSLGTGAWALDQSWHIFWGVFVASLLAVTL